MKYRRFKKKRLYFFWSKCIVNFEIFNLFNIFESESYWVEIFYWEVYFLYEILIIYYKKYGYIRLSWCDKYCCGVIGWLGLYNVWEFEL